MKLNSRFGYLALSFVLLLASPGLAVEPSCIGLISKGSTDAERSLQVVKNYFNFEPFGNSVWQFRRKLGIEKKEVFGNFDLRITNTPTAFSVTVNGKTEVAFGLDPADPQSLTIIRVGKELIFEFEQPRIHHRLTFIKDDQGNIDSVTAEDLRRERITVLDQPATTNEEAKVPLRQPPILTENDDGPSVRAAVEGYFRKQFRGKKVAINFSKFGDGKGQERLESNTFTFELGMKVITMYIGNRGLGVWTSKTSPIKILDSKNNGELHLQLTGENYVRKIFFQKDDLGNISSMTWIQTSVAASGQVSTEVRSYYN